MGRRVIEDDDAWGVRADGFSEIFSRARSAKDCRYFS